MYDDDDEHHNKPSQYQRLVAKLIYRTGIKPDISFVIGAVSTVNVPKKKEKPIQKSKAKATLEHINMYPVSNVDYIDSIMNKKSTSRFCIFVEENLINKKRKHIVMERSMVETEYKAMAI